MTAPKRIAILGSTGSIGRAALDVVAASPGAFEVVAITAFSNSALLAEQAARFGARRVAVGDEAESVEFAPGVDVLRGALALDELAGDPDLDLVLNALVGSSGLRPALAAIRAGNRVAVANKESLVMAGELLIPMASATGSELIPVDSEHSAIFRCLKGTRTEEVEGITLTASGGPLRGMSSEAAAVASLEDVLDHPTWEMGRKVTVDSASMFNKGLEVIEAHWLFDLPYDRIDVVVHPESIVHSLVRLTDGSLLAHLGEPDMKVPIQFAMFYPEPAPVAFGRCDLGVIGGLSFGTLDETRYPCYGLMLDAGRIGGTAPTIAATADEVAVEAFTESRIRFGEIASVIDATLKGVRAEPADEVDHILAAEDEARACALSAVAQLVS